MHKPDAVGPWITTYVVQKLGTSVSFNIVTVEVAPTELNINPVFVTGCTIWNIFDLLEESAERLIDLRWQKPTSVTSEGLVIFH